MRGGAGGVPMLKLPAVLTHTEANACLAAWLSQLPLGEGPVAVNGEELQRFDSAALATLLELRRHLHAQRRGLVLEAAPPRLQELAALYGVDELLAI